MDHLDDRVLGRTPNAMNEDIVDETLDEGLRDGDDMPRLSDDTDLEPEGNGLEATQWRHEYRTVTLRSDLARIFEDLLVGVNEWADEDGSEEARMLQTDLQDLYSRIEEPVEETDRAADNEGPDIDSPA